MRKYYTDDTPICSAIVEDISVAREPKSEIDEIEITCCAFFGRDSFRVAQTSAGVKEGQQIEITKLRNTFKNFNPKKSFSLNIKCDGRNREGIERNFDCTEFR